MQKQQRTHRLRLQEFEASWAGGSIFWPSDKLVIVDGILATTQWTHGVADGASGSSTISTKDLVPAGTFDQDRGGDRLSPFLAYFMGIVPPFSKPEHVSTMGPLFVVEMVADKPSVSLDEDHHTADTTKTAARAHQSGALWEARPARVLDFFLTSVESTLKDDFIA
eukprot:scaffold2212_cov143-Cylindrotheca_fusiformis.AAC.4